MARIKFTGPVSTVQLQPAPILQDSVLKNGISVRTEAQTEIENISRSIIQENTLLKQQQSLEFVQIMLHVSLGTLFYLREFLPLPCFDDRDLKEAQRDNNLSYREFINGKQQAETSEALARAPFGTGRRGQPLKIIIRDSNPKANTILDVLENGIFDALRKNVLSAVQFTIILDKDEPENVLESYTFTFKYTGGHGVVNSRLESLSINPVGCVADVKTAQTARVGLEMIVRRLITLSAFLPTLPNKRNLGVHLFYTEDCPPDYEPPGFTGALNDTIKYPLTENWRKETQSCGSMDSGWHSVGLKVTSLKWVGPDPEGSEAVPKVPTDLEYRDVVQRSEDIGLADGGSLEGSQIHESVNPAGEPPQEATQDVTERNRLQTMIPTQGTPSYMDSQLVPTQPINPSVAVDHDSSNIVNSDHKFELSEQKISEIQEHLKSRNGSPGKNQERTIRCQCGWDSEESAMLECAFCHMRQHVACYGFDGPNDPRIPDIHACYQCLLEPKEIQLLCEMNSLVLLRRALKIIIEEGYPSRTSLFTQKLHCNGQTVIQITDILKKQNILQPTPGYKQKGFLRRGLPKFNIPSSDQIQLKIKNEIFNPMTKIGHHYNQKVSGDSQETRQSIKSTELARGNESNFYDKEMSTDADKINAQVSAELANPLAESLEAKNDLKRKQAPEANDDAYDSDDLDRSDTRSSAQRNTFPTQSSEAHELVTTNDISITSQTQVPHSPPESEGTLRRSGRKRRKISNYTRLLDIGAATSEDEPMR
ncbi:putative meiosis specific protein Hop1 [Aspergillus clavatus NRRL 1]|uniref:Meiosis specific protein Hop1, putative n=1 Tax=Aspergillus clavatus (strain ATCC 1007 / CBS 513.65 / DSM 816 / NCTC 3887 / NRRL 1 / QM 1276 / 107) TaxID=344612 RepID=A1CUE4_ASPCL|nr:meiosis specific protein Hop1, putative [Aspergillus clavatus NRRL 1]EAW06931.1 meiosis specific protein Hop1, putative [Aspergillus clavatus NRRL 1]